jgi:dihydrofolate reductase
VTARKVLLYINVTLDGFIAGPGGEVDWALPDPEPDESLGAAMRKRVDTILTGRTFYQAFEQNSAGFSDWMINTPKVVFSTSLTKAAAGARVVDGDPRAVIAALRDEPGGDLVLFGGVDIVQQFVQLRLIDEYWIKLHPLAIGFGQPLFTGLKQRADLTLAESKSWDSGILTLRYLAAG